jgi:hypothetical protein
VNAITEDFMQALVKLPVQETNVAMSNSGVSTQLNLVYSYRSNSNEMDNNGSTSLTDLRPRRSKRIETSKTKQGDIWCRCCFGDHRKFI